MSSLAEIRETLAAVSRHTAEAREALAAAGGWLDDAVRHCADADAGTHEGLPTAALTAARDDVRAVLADLDRASGIVDDLDARL